MRWAITVVVLMVAGCSPASGAAERTVPKAEPPIAAPCAVTGELIPTCGAWWGLAPEVFTGRGLTRGLQRAEQRMGRRADILHVYHRAGELFPTDEERALVQDRLLLVNWKPSLRHLGRDRLGRARPADRQARRPHRRRRSRSGSS